MAEWFVTVLTIVMLSLVREEGMAEDFIKNKGAPPISRAGWSIMLLIIAMLPKEGSTKDPGTSSIRTTLAT